MRSWLLLAAAAVVAQQALTTYPDSQGGAGVFWVALSLVLLWFVYRRHNIARLLFAAITAIGFVLFALAAIDDLTSTGTLLAVLYGIQAVTMLVRPVRAWTSTELAGRAVSPAK